ncbi:MAG: hypothetical protein EP340_09160 [Alphaproteobacteria bacterium]|nr:MAG: hypothetical protein EP340_09160 [Alphaproteobacteria bacterium]
MTRLSSAYSWEKFMRRLLQVSLLLLVFGFRPAFAADEANAPCTSEMLKAFDFWLGEWQVFDKESGKLIAYDRVEKDLGNCVVTERWTSLDDTFRNASAPFRMRGMSLSALDGQGWVQIWVDNMGGTIIMHGGPEEGAMVLKTQTTSYGFHYRYHYEPLPDGSVHGFGYSKPDGQDNWTKDWDLIYKRNG